MAFIGSAHDRVEQFGKDTAKEMQGFLTKTYPDALIRYLHHDGSWLTFSIQVYGRDFRWQYPLRASQSSIIKHVVKEVKHYIDSGVHGRKIYLEEL